jgi:membrane associated rhomboid family serine protease
MFIPLYDGVVLRHLRRPWATWGIFTANVLVFAVVSSGALAPPAAISLAFGVIPAEIFGEKLGYSAIAPPLTVLTAMFLHGGFWHLAGNMLFLHVFGDNVEDAMGSVRFLIFYGLCGLAAALGFCLAQPFSQAPLIGASGPIAGVVTAYLLLYPRVYVFGLVFIWLPLRIRAVYCLGAWLAFQLSYALFGGDPEVGWWAHVGGGLAGLVLTPLFKRPQVALFSAREN